MVAERLQQVVELAAGFRVLEDQCSRQQRWCDGCSNPLYEPSDKRHVDTLSREEGFQNTLALEEIPNRSRGFRGWRAFDKVEQKVGSPRFQQVRHCSAHLRPHGADLDRDLNHSL